MQVRILQSLSHPNIIRTFEVFEQVISLNL
jgi:hypothetical protein